MSISYVLNVLRMFVKYVVEMARIHLDYVFIVVTLKNVNIARDLGISWIEKMCGFVINAMSNL